ncbi:MAG TPA: transglutaminase-like domain-containing protein [Desulfurivibrionaceae bacterium]|nr:transglutaminase-like domain-containing protein [Desulfurivibrionaceae bacterium]
MTITPKLKKNLLRVGLLVLWAILFGLLLRRDYFIRTLETREAQVIKKGREESFAGIYFREGRIGYVKNRLVPDVAGGSHLSQEAYLRLNILDQVHPVHLMVEADLAGDGKLRDFEFQLTSPFYTMQARGKVEGTRVDFTLNTGKDEINDSIQLSQPPYLSTNRRGYLLTQNLKKGDKLRLPYFDPLSLTGKDTVVEYLDYDKQLINNRIYLLHKFSETFSGVKISFWLDDEGKVIKEESPAGFVFLAEPEFRATDLPTAGKEILSSVSVTIKGEIPADYATRRELRFRLTLPEEGEFDLDRDRQELVGSELTVRRETLPSETAGVCEGQQEDLASTPYIQTGNQVIGEQVAKILGETQGELAKVKKLAAWVYENLEKRPVLGIPDALTTLQTRRGDCNEHAALFAALARRAGIPTRVAAGVTYHAGAFYYHAWNEVCLDGRWLSLDTTKNQLPADVTHIRFVNGETDEQIKIGALLGKLGIEVVK